MLGSLRDMIRLIGFVGGILLTLSLAMPAFASHVCASELAPPVAETIAMADDGGEAQCPDCGLACANGCCHVSHTATPVDVAAETKGLTFAPPVVWGHQVGCALDAPSGPERPPRL